MGTVSNSKIIEIEQAFSDAAKYFPTPIQQFQFFDKYSRFNYEKGRRETWPETVKRCIDFLRELSENKLDEVDYQRLESGILNMNVAPSMRLLAMAGDAARRNHISIYNCSTVPMDSIDSFVEVLLISMAGTGVGYSVEKQYVNKLPIIVVQSGITRDTLIIPDTTEGWGEALKMGLETWFSGDDITFDYSHIRKAGIPLKIKGGTASGPEPLQKLLDFARKRILAKQGSQLSTVDVHDIVCMIGNCVVSGAVRRSALISLFDYDDIDMRNCKNGDFEAENSQRWFANNSAVWDKELSQVEIMEQMLDMFKGQRGEPGIFSRVAANKTKPHRRSFAPFQTNPCITGDTLIAVADGRNAVSVKQLVDEGKDVLVYSRNLETGKVEIKTARNPRKTGIKQEVWKVILDDGTFIKATPNHKFITKDFKMKELKDLQNGDSLSPFNTFNSNRYRQVCESGALMIGGHRRNRRQYRLIHEFYNGFIDPKKYAIHHKDINSYNDSIENLLMIMHEEHRAIHTKNMLGDKNPYHRMSSEWKFNFASHPKEKNPKYCGLTNQQLVEEGRKVFQKYGKFSYPLWIEYAKKHKLPQFLGNEFRFGSFTNFKNQVASNHKVVSVEFQGYEDVYNLTVDDNHNYGVITSGEENFVISSGVFVKNCGEISLRPYQFCNLSQIIARPTDTLDTLMEKAELATIIGTIQSMATNFPGLRSIWKQNCEEERLLGVDLNGQADVPLVRDIHVMQQLKEQCIETNIKYAKILGINRSAAITCVKPNGNSSVLFDCASGLHPRHAKYYIRNVRVGTHTPIYQVLKECGVPMSPENGQQEKTANTWVAHFPVKAPDEAITKDQVSALDQCKTWYLNKMNFTEHNPSITVSYKADEVISLTRWIFEHQDIIGGMSFLPVVEAKYSQMPYEEITQEEYEKLAKEFPNIDFSLIVKYEKKDMTTSSMELACVSGVCDWNPENIDFSSQVSA